MRTDKGRSLKDSLEKANGHDALRVVDGGGNHGEAAPAEHHAGEPDARLDIVEGKIGRDLAQNIAASPMLLAASLFCLSATPPVSTIEGQDQSLTQR